MFIFRKNLKRWIRNRGYEVRRVGTGEMDDISRLARVAGRKDIGVFLDIGANAGQFAVDLRFAGFGDRIISFEPTEAAHAALEKRARLDPKWTVAPRIALGSENSTSQINVAGNSYSSSLLPMTAAHVNAAPESAYVQCEEIAVRRLDDVMTEMQLDNEGPLAIKIDTQGYEAQVLAGASSTISRVHLLFTEMSLAPMYAGSPTFYQMYSWLQQAGFRCIGLSHEMSDFTSGEMLQVNGTFIRD